MKPATKPSNRAWGFVKFDSHSFEVMEGDDEQELEEKCYILRNGGISTRVGTLIVATIYLQLIQNRYMFRSFTVLQCSHQHCVQPVASDVEVVGYL